MQKPSGRFFTILQGLAETTHTEQPKTHQLLEAPHRSPGATASELLVALPRRSRPCLAPVAAQSARWSKEWLCASKGDLENIRKLKVCRSYMIHHDSSLVLPCFLFAKDDASSRSGNTHSSLFKPLKRSCFSSGNSKI